MEYDVDCPVCHGTGKAYVDKTGSFTGRPCMSCEGSGIACFCQRYADEVGIDTPRRGASPKTKIEDEDPSLSKHVLLSRNTKNYLVYCAVCREVGVEPISDKLITGRRRYYRIKYGTEGLVWQPNWSGSEVKIAMRAKSYGEYVAGIKKLTKEKGEDYVVRTMKAFHAFVHRRRHASNH